MIQGLARRSQGPLSPARSRQEWGRRTIYYVAVAPGTLFMMSAYPKNERDDLSPDQRKAILAAIDSIKGGPPP